MLIFYSLLCLCFCDSIGVDFGSFYTKSSNAEPFSEPILNLRNSKISTPSFIGFRAKPHFNVTNRKPLSLGEVEFLTPEIGDRAFSIMDTRPWMGTGYFSAFLGFNIKRMKPDIFSALHVNETAARLKYNELIALYLHYYMKGINGDSFDNQIAVCVPATTTAEQRIVIETAMSIIGYDNVSVIDDTDAAAYAYYIENKENLKDDNENVLFIDVGATSVKGYILEFNHKAQKVTRMNYAIQHGVGGAYITNEITDYILEKTGIKDVSVDERQRIFTASERLKKQLSTDSEGLSIVENVLGRDFEFKLKREELESMKTLEELKTAVLSVIQDSLTNIKSLHDVKIIGGTSQLPFVHSLIETSPLIQKFFKNFEISNSADHEGILAIGAAYFAQAQNNQTNHPALNIEDFSPMNTIRLIGNHSQVFEICHKNSKNKCLKDVMLYGNTTQVTITSDVHELRKGLDRVNLTYNVQPYPAGSIYVSFAHHPTRIRSIQKCDNNECTPNPFLLRSLPKLSKDIVLMFISPEFRESTIIKTRKELEEFSSHVLNDIEKNRTVRYFSNYSQRIEAIRAAEKAKKWVQSKEGQNCNSLNNFTVLLSEVKRGIGPIYLRIEENSSFYDEVDRIGTVLNFWGQAAQQIAAQGQGMDLSQVYKFTEKIKKTKSWVEEALQINAKSPPYLFLPIRPKQIKEKFLETQNDFYKLQDLMASLPKSPNFEENREKMIKQQEEKLLNMQKGIFDDNDLLSPKSLEYAKLIEEEIQRQREL